MTKKPVRKRQGGKHDPPKTIGDLRHLLSQLGDPWRPDPRLSDDEPIPEFPTGGDGTKEPPGKLLPKRGVIDFLKKDLPSNPFLREVWKERGILGKSDKPRKSRLKSRQPGGSG